MFLWFEHFTCSSVFTGKSLSESLLFAEHGENMLCTEIVSDIQNKFLYTTCSTDVLQKEELLTKIYL